MIYLKIEKSKLITGKAQIDFNHNIDEVIVADESMLVLLKDYSSEGGVDIKKQPLNNAYSINSKSKIIWNIKDIINEDDLYVGLDIDDANKNQVRITSFEGKVYILNIKSKKVVAITYTK